MLQYLTMHVQQKPQWAEKMTVIYLFRYFYIILILLGRMYLLFYDTLTNLGLWLFTQITKLERRGDFITSLSLILLSFDKPLVEVQVQTDNWVFIKIIFSNRPATTPPSQPGKFQRSKLQQYIQNKSCVYVLGGYKTCFEISQDPKNIRWESKRAKNLSIKDFFNPAK